MPSSYSVIFLAGSTRGRENYYNVSPVPLGVNTAQTLSNNRTEILVCLHMLRATSLQMSTTWSSRLGSFSHLPTFAQWKILDAVPVQTFRGATGLMDYKAVAVRDVIMTEDKACVWLDLKVCRSLLAYAEIEDLIVKKRTNGYTHK